MVSVRKIRSTVIRYLGSIVKKFGAFHIIAWEIHA